MNHKLKKKYSLNNISINLRKILGSEEIFNKKKKIKINDVEPSKTKNRKMYEHRHYLDIILQSIMSIIMFR